MANEEHFELVQALGRDLQAGEIRLPSLPAVVMKIRTLLEEDNSDFEAVSEIVSVDTALASKLLLYANSAYHNRTGAKVANLEAAIAKLGLDLVKSTAVALVVKQLVLAQEQSRIRKHVHDIWSRSIRLSAMSHALAEQHDELNEETAFMCGLLHDIGKLYILDKAKDIPGFLTDAESFRHVFEEWSPQIGRCIVEAWGFPTDVVESVDPGEFLDEHIQRAPTMVDVVYIAANLIDGNDGKLQDILAIPAARKLHITEESVPIVFADYKEKLATVRQSLA